VLQCVAVCCSVLQCVAVCCSVLQCVAVCCSVLQCVSECCSVLQCVFQSEWSGGMVDKECPPEGPDDDGLVWIVYTHMRLQVLHM